MFRMIACLLLATASVAVAEEKYKADDLVGKWTLVQLPRKGPETSINFTINKDGTFLAEIAEGKEMFKSTGKWKLDGETVTITHDMGGKTSKPSIVKLTADTLVLKDSNSEETYKKVKEEKK